jgi:hypothetical protein
VLVTRLGTPGNGSLTTTIAGAVELAGMGVAAELRGNGFVPSVMRRQ